MRVRSAEYKAKQRELKREQRTKRRNDAIELLGGVCAQCGGTDRLQFDHIDRRTKSFPIGTPPSDRAFWQELQKCQLLCYPCHRLKSRREMSGDNNPVRKLNSSQVIEIRARLDDGAVGAALAREYGVGPMQISRIKNRQRWKDAA